MNKVKSKTDSARRKERFPQKNDYNLNSRPDINEMENGMIQKRNEEQKIEISLDQGPKRTEEDRIQGILQRLHQKQPSQEIH